MKKIPYGTNKQDLVSMYLNQLPENEIRYEINIIFKKNNRSISKNSIPHLLFMEFIKKFGLPRGYEE